MAGARTEAEMEVKATNGSDKGVKTGSDPDKRPGSKYSTLTLLVKMLFPLSASKMSNLCLCRGNEIDSRGGAGI